MNSFGIPQYTRNTEAGKRLRQKICEKDASVVFYHSPYLRTKQTLDEIMPFFNEDEVVSCLEEPRICEQQIGNFQNVQQVLGKQARNASRPLYSLPLWTKLSLLQNKLLLLDNYLNRCQGRKVRIRSFLLSFPVGRGWARCIQQSIFLHTYLDTGLYSIWNIRAQVRQPEHCDCNTWWVSNGLALDCIYVLRINVWIFKYCHPNRYDTGF